MLRIRCFALVAVMAVAPVVNAQMGSPGHGETQVVALHPTDAGIMYAGAAKGLCKTVNGGLDNWPTYGLDMLSPRTIVVSQARPDLLYVGTYKMGVYRSDDGAANWRPVNDGLTDLRIRAMVIDPNDDRTVYVGTDGTGVFRTTNGGESWEQVNRGLLDKVIRTLVIDTERPETIYAGTWNGVYKTTNGGDSWSADPEGLYDVDVRALAISPADSSHLVAGTATGAVFRSSDGGEAWTLSPQALLSEITALTIDPANPHHIYVGTKAGVFISTNQGESFETAGLRWSNHVWYLGFDTKTDSPTLYYGGVGGVLKTNDRGLHWDVTGPIRR